MQRLKMHKIEPSLKVLSENWQFPFQCEQNSLAINVETKTLIREVLISTQQLRLMYARTIFPPETLTGEEEELAHLKNRSLGSFLFKHPDLVRSEFLLASLKPHMEWYKKSVEYLEELPASLWARRSQFFLHGKPLLLTEVFLPDMQQICS